MVTLQEPSTKILSVGGAESHNATPGQSSPSWRRALARPGRAEHTDGNWPNSGRN